MHADEAGCTSHQNFNLLSIRIRSLRLSLLLAGHESLRQVEKSQPIAIFSAAPSPPPLHAGSFGC